MKEFKTRFQEPIENGQASDSHVDALTQAKKRSFVLRHELSDIVLRRDANFLKSLLGEKHEWVVSCRMSSLQNKLYKINKERAHTTRSCIF